MSNSLLKGPSDHALAQPFELDVLAVGSETAISYEVEIRFIDLQGVARSVRLPRSRAVRSKPLARRLIDEGVRCTDIKLLAEQLRRTLTAAEERPPIVVVDRPGWHGRSFVMPGAGINSVRLEQAQHHPYASRTGTKAGWLTLFGRSFNPSSHHLFATTLPLAAPLLRFSEAADGAGVIFVQEGTGSFETVMQAASSVWCASPPDLAGRAERARRGRETATDFADLPRFIPPLERRDLSPVAEMARLLGNSSYSSGSSDTSCGAAAARVRSLLISVADVPFERAHAMMRGRSPAGAPIIVVPAHPNASDAFGCRVFERTASKVEIICAEHAGHMLSDFVAAVVAQFDELPAWVASRVGEFVSSVKPSKPLSREETTILRFFGLICAAGQFAAERGIAPWTARQCTVACRYMASAHFAIAAQSDPTTVIRRIQDVAHDPSYFPIVEERRAVPSEAVGIAWGVRRRIDGKETLLVAPDRLARLGGLDDAQAAAEALAKQLGEFEGLTIAGNDGRLFRQASVLGWDGGSGRQRWLCLDVEQLQRLTGRISSSIEFAPLDPPASGAALCEVKSDRQEIRAGRNRRCIDVIRPRRPLRGSTSAS